MQWKYKQSMLQCYHYRVIWVFHIQQSGSHVYNKVLKYAVLCKGTNIHNMSINFDGVTAIYDFA